MKTVFQLSLAMMCIVLAGPDVQAQWAHGQWTHQMTDTLDWYKSVKAVNGNVAWAAGWAAGSNGCIRRTTNGGTAWTSVGGSGFDSIQVMSIEALDANVRDKKKSQTLLLEKSISPPLPLTIRSRFAKVSASSIV